MVEAISVSNTHDPENRRSDSLFPKECYPSPMVQQKANTKDTDFKNSPYYIRKKLELGVMADRIAYPWVKVTMMIILIVYMYGAMMLKYVAGAESLYQGLSFLIEGNMYEWDSYWVYIVSLLIFWAMSTACAFGDIENSKLLQIITAWSRVIMLFLFYLGTFIYLGEDGMHKGKVFDWKTQTKSLSTVFGNTVFVFIYHHSIPGIMYPVRPQNKLNRMFLISNIVGAILLCLEGQLAFWAFGGLTNDCTEYPCKVQKLYNENF